MFRATVNSTSAFRKLDQVLLQIEEVVQFSINTTAEDALIKGRMYTPKITGNLRRTGTLVSKNPIGIPVLPSEDGMATGSFKKGVIVPEDNVLLATGYTSKYQAALGESFMEDNPNIIYMYTAYYNAKAARGFQAGISNFKANAATRAAKELNSIIRG